MQPIAQLNKMQPIVQLEVKLTVQLQAQPSMELIGQPKWQPKM